MSKRPTFWYNGQPVRAAGILIWTRHNGRILRLMNHCRGRFEDMGGKTDSSDRNELDTAVRECAEETNGRLFSQSHSIGECKRWLYQHVRECSDVQYNSRSKYLLFRVYVNSTILNLNMKRFALCERTEWGVLEHYFQWLSQIPSPIHPRLHALCL
jgi:8-oxo-dGTP pyrophosphatase MutT (NUDIX family)